MSRVRRQVQHSGLGTRQQRWLGGPQRRQRFLWMPSPQFGVGCDRQAAPVSRGADVRTFCRAERGGRFVPGRALGSSMTGEAVPIEGNRPFAAFNG